MTPVLVTPSPKSQSYAVIVRPGGAVDRVASNRTLVVIFGADGENENLGVGVGPAVVVTVCEALVLRLYGSVTVSVTAKVDTDEYT